MFCFVLLFSEPSVLFPFCGLFSKCIFGRLLVCVCVSVQIGAQCLYLIGSSTLYADWLFRSGEVMEPADVLHLIGQEPLDTTGRVFICTGDSGW